MDIKKLTDLLGDDNKAYILDEQGNVKLVLMSMDYYQQLSRKRSASDLHKIDVEEINRRILKAQLELDALPQFNIVPQKSKQPDLRSEVIIDNLNVNDSFGGIRKAFDEEDEPIVPEFDDI